MAAEDQGIMSLPMEGEAASQNMPQISLAESYDAVQQGLQNASPQASADIQQLMASIMPQLDQLSDEELDSFLQTIQYLYDGGEAEYAKRLKEVIATGAIDEGDLPEEYDPEVLSSIGTVLLQAIRTRQGATAQEPMPPVQQFAKGGIAEAARLVASKGRNGDTMLAHITPDEARMLKARGGSGTINPKTGLPEFFLKKIAKAFKSVVKGVVNAVKSIVKSPIGKVLATVALATFLGPAGASIGGGFFGATTATALASGAVTALGGGNLKQVLTSAATAYFGAPGGVVSQYVGAAGITNAAANAAVTAGIVGTGAGMLTGQKLSDAVKSGLTAGAISGLTTALQPTVSLAEPSKVPVEDRGSMLAPLPPEAGVTPQVVEGSAPPVMASRSVQPPAAPSGPVNEFNQVYTPLPPVASGLQLPPGAAPEPGYAVAGSPMAAQAAPGAPAPAPGAMESLTKTAGGIGDLMRGRPGAFDTIKEGASNLFMPKTYTPAELQTSEVFAGAREAGASYAEAMKQAQAAYNPSITRQYGPMVAAGLGAAGMMGAFSPSKVPPSQMAQQMRGTPGLDLINRNPNQYLVQGLPGVQYTPEGNITGSSTWSPTATMADVQVATPNYGGGISSLPQNRPMYSPAPGAMGFARGIVQPGNTAGMYGNLMNTGYNPYGYFTAADGGLASLARGGYPRKTGAISGPGTETSDSIPAMLSDGEFVMTAKAVKGLGGGSRRAGAKKMYALMHQLERNASRG